MMTNPFVGNWSYRSFLNDPNLNKPANDLLFGAGTLTIVERSETELSGTIGGPGWSLDLRGSFGYGSPMQVRFQGKGTVGGEPWIYDYIGWLVPVWPNSADQLEAPAIVGSVVRTIPHGASPAGVVASFYAVRAN
ncbi:hypothetical protein [Nitrobacter winogradskyi]|uniref:Uncharacterized protein n=2 Tax=Nitrobacter winogradskyi TaxID=913 RepID=A0ACC6AI81_NITWI|nr:hypothetical protein [Nitrobacter winogradskyi]MCP1999396.1 hypothetical protein [Nitrobacter winogradskyi]